MGQIPDDIAPDVWDTALSVEIDADWSYDGQTGGRAEEQRGREAIARELLSDPHIVEADRGLFPGMAQSFEWRDLAV